MASQTLSPPSPSFASPASRARSRLREMPLPRPELALLLVLAAALNLWALSRNGYANEYYSAAVRSMTESWHAFLYGSFDVAGVMTVDKPPLALWVQALSARAFGFGSWSLLAPQALMGVASVGLVYDLTRRPFGRAAGFVAGLTLAFTPVAVALARHNNPDALLVLACVAAVWCLVRGLADGRTRWLLLAGLFVGLGFEAKMAAALLVVPGIAAAWLWVAPRGRLIAFGQLAAGGAVATVVGLAWPLLVWLTPAADRPWVSGTADNSVWSLILGYNGLGRLVGQDGGPGGGPGGGGPGGFFGGEPGVGRLLNASLGGQAGWLLGFALVSAVALLVVSRAQRADPRTGWLVAVGGTFATIAVAFSFAGGIFHPYYVSQLAPFAAALVGAGAGLLLGGGRTARVLGPLAIVGGIATELLVLRAGVEGFAWLPPVLVALGGGAAVALAAGVGPRARAIAVATAMGVLLLAPAAWSVQTLGHATSGTFPAGGPVESGLAGGPGGGGPGGNVLRGGPPGGLAPGSGGGPPGGLAGPSGRAGAPPATAGGGGSASGGGGGTTAGGGAPFGGTSESLTSALAYARQHGGGTVAVSSQSGAGRLITEGADVAAIGGFSGRESEVTVAWLADAVERGQIRWVLTEAGGGGMPMDGRTGSTTVMSAVERSCTATSVDGLYDCRGSADALRSS